jgi:hypothetical protein
MTCPRVANGGDALEICRVTANILNKKSRTADKGLGEGPTTPHRKKPACYEMLHRASDLDGFFGTT